MVAAERFDEVDARRVTVEGKEAFVVCTVSLAKEIGDLDFKLRPATIPGALVETFALKFMGMVFLVVSTLSVELPLLTMPFGLN